MSERSEVVCCLFNKYAFWDVDGKQGPEMRHARGRRHAFGLDVSGATGSGTGECREGSLRYTVLVGIALILLRDVWMCDAQK